MLVLVTDVPKVCNLLQIAQQTSTSYLDKFASSSAVQLPPAETIQQRFLPPTSNSNTSLAFPKGPPATAATKGGGTGNRAGQDASSPLRLQLPLLRPAPVPLAPLPGAQPHCHTAPYHL